MYKDSYLNCNLYVTETQLLQLQFVPMLQEYTGLQRNVSHFHGYTYKYISYVMLHFTLGWVLLKKLRLQQ